MTTKKNSQVTKKANQGVNLVQNVDAILKHSDTLQGYTKLYKWLSERETRLQQVMDAYVKHKKVTKNAKENIFETEDINFDFKINILPAQETYTRDSLVEIRKPEVVGAFVNTLLEFIVEEKIKLFNKINELETNYAKDLTK